MLHLTAVAIWLAEIMALHCLFRVLSPTLVLFCYLFDIIPRHSSLPENAVVSSFSGYFEVSRIQVPVTKSPL